VSIQGIQCTIGGFSGAPATLFSALDEDTGILTFAVVAAQHKARREGCVVISNIAVDDRDMAFDDARIREAIEAWNVLRSDRLDDGSPRLVFAERARRADPASMIEPDGVNERGRQYRLAEHVGNEAVATLATCLWAHGWDARTNVLETASSLADDLLAGQAVTVAGIPPWEINPVFVHGYQVDQAAAAAYWDVRDR